jgi:vacuolar-type H+-ATPase subunit H
MGISGKAPKGVSMAVELVEILRAEEEADAIVKAAKERHEARVKQALEEQQAAFSTNIAMRPRPLHLSPIKTDEKRLRAIAAKNRERALKRIMEAIYAAA